MYEKFLPYIDIADGLNRLRGNKKLFLRLLESFFSTTDIASVDPSLFEKNEDARIAAHSLKGVSGNLSLKKIYTCALELENAIKQSNPAAQLYVELFNAYKETEVLLLEVKELLGE